MLPENCPFIDWEKSGTNFFYQLKRDPRFDLFKNRLIVEWGNSTLSWHQYTKVDKKILEIKPAGRLLADFDDYLEFTITHQELKHIVQNHEAHKDWKSRLSAVSGVYLILDSKTGLQYVGSAYGATGVWGRWSEYTKTGHGGNTALRALFIFA